MPDTTRPSAVPAYVASVAALHTRATARMDDPSLANILDGLRIPIHIDGASEHTPCAQAELAIQDRVRHLIDREPCAVLWRDRDGGDLFVMHAGRFVPVGVLQLIPAQRQVRAA
jgi:hypothetical protein